MISNEQPGFLQRAKRVESPNPTDVSPKTEKGNQPSFLQRARKVEEKTSPYEEEGFLEKEIERNIAQQTSRIGETLLGLPGDLVNFVGGLFGYKPDLPGSQKFRELSEEYSFGYTKPQAPHEEMASELMSDIAGFMTPGAGKYNLVRNIGIPVAANLAKEGVKYAGADEKTASWTKLGTMIVLDLMNLRNGGAKKYASSLFNESEALIPEGATLASSKLENSISSLKNTLESGGTSPSKTQALTKVSEISDKMKNGQILVKELVDFRKSINEIKLFLGGWEVQLPKAIKKKAIANLDMVKNQVVKALEEYGQHNKEFGKLNRAANEAWAAYEQSHKISNFIEKSARHVIKNNATKALLGLGGYTFPGLIKPSLIAGSALYSASKGYEILHQVTQSPTLRKYYGNILKGAAVGNASQVSKNVKLLDEALKED